MATTRKTKDLNAKERRARGGSSPKKKTTTRRRALADSHCIVCGKDRPRKNGAETALPSSWAIHAGKERDSLTCSEPCQRMHETTLWPETTQDTLAGSDNNRAALAARSGSKPTTEPELAWDSSPPTAKPSPSAASATETSMTSGESSATSTSSAAASGNGKWWQI